MAIELFTVAVSVSRNIAAPDVEGTVAIAGDELAAYCVEANRFDRRAIAWEGQSLGWISKLVRGVQLVNVSRLGVQGLSPKFVSCHILLSKIPI